jgi:hypothetical protein
LRSVEFGGLEDYKPDVVDALTLAHEGGATTTAITNYSPSPITQGADIALLTVSWETPSQANPWVRQYRSFVSWTCSLPRLRFNSANPVLKTSRKSYLR